MKAITFVGEHQGTCLEGPIVAVLDGRARQSSPRGACSMFHVPGGGGGGGGGGGEGVGGEWVGYGVVW